MKKIAVLLVSSGFLFAQETFDMRLLEGINQVQRSIELAKKSEVDKRNPYHFEKAKVNRDVAKILASELDDVGAKVFMVKSFNALSKAGSGKLELDSIEFVGGAEAKNVKDKEKGSKSNAGYKQGLWLDLNFLNTNLRYVRENMGLSCAPVELARAEVYYDAMAYELSKPRPSITRLTDFYSKSQVELDKAIDKVNIAKEGKLECYTSKPFVPETAKTEEVKVPEVAKTEEVKVEPAPTPITSEVQGGPLMVTARVHFDLGKYNIKKEYIPLLNEVVKILKENPNINIRIEGFTDDTGSKAYNDRLALRRAQTVRDYLVNAGIPADRIQIAGFGKERYIADNTTPIGKFTNRRAEFIVIQVPSQ